MIRKFKKVSHFLILWKNTNFALLCKINKMLEEDFITQQEK